MPTDTLEIEMKFPLAESTTLLDRLRQRGARGTETLHEADHYFNAPDRDFARTDEALRIRRIGSANRLTYKGPKLDAQTKTRTEIEVGLAEGDQAAEDFARLLTSLGYRSVAVVRKQRRIFHLQEAGFQVEVCLDDVEAVGQFAELEIIAPKQQLDEACGVLHRLAAELGLSGSERRSYLELLLGKTNSGT